MDKHGRNEMPKSAYGGHRDGHNEQFILSKSPRAICQSSIVTMGKDRITLLVVSESSLSTIASSMDDWTSQSPKSHTKSLAGYGRALALAHNHSNH